MASRSKLLPSWLCTLYLLKRKCRGGAKLDPDGRESLKSTGWCLLLFCSVVSLLRSLVRSVLQCEADEHGVLEALGLIVKTL